MCICCCLLHGGDIKWTPLCCLALALLNVAVQPLSVSPQTHKHTHTHTHTHTRMFSSALFSISSMRVNLWICSSALLLSFSVSSSLLLLLLFSPLSSLHPPGLYTACLSASQHGGGAKRLPGCSAGRLAWN